MSFTHKLPVNELQCHLKRYFKGRFIIDSFYDFYSVLGLFSF